MIFRSVSLKIVMMMVMVSCHVYAQEANQSVSLNEKKHVIEEVASNLISNYVFPEIAKEMAKTIKTKLKNNDYSHIKDPIEFAKTLTNDLQAISNDKHLRVRFDPEGIKSQSNGTLSSFPSIDRVKEMKRNNFGFKELKVLEGNVGYLDLRSFSETYYAGETARKAMNFLSNTDAIIIDLRKSKGGSPSMVQLLSSYFFEGTPIHLNNFYWRATDTYTQTWTLSHVPGKRMPDVPVYILTSKTTFSAAEGFPYHLKHLKRATIIGEVTGGGAHLGGQININQRFFVWVPIGRAINPITNSNWEGIGVIPQIKTPVEEALNVAHKLALERINKDKKR